MDDKKGELPVIISTLDIENTFPLSQYGFPGSSARPLPTASCCSQFGEARSAAHSPKHIRMRIFSNYWPACAALMRTLLSDTLYVCTSSALDMSAARCLCTYSAEVALFDIVTRAGTINYDICLILVY